MGAAEVPLAAPPVPRMLQTNSKITCGCGAKYETCAECHPVFCHSRWRYKSECSLAHGKCVRTGQEACLGKDISMAIVAKDEVFSLPGHECIDGQTLNHNETCPLVCKPGATKVTDGLVKCNNGTVEVTPATCTITPEAQSALAESGVTCMGAQFRTCAECDLQWCATSFDDEPCEIGGNNGGEPVCQPK